jgi:hypothetical protein
MFVLQKKTEPFWYSVDVPIVTETGTSRTHRFDVQFSRFTRSELNDLRKRSEGMSDNGDALENDTDYVLEIAKDWRGVSDGKADLPFTRENVLALLDAVPNAASAIVSAFFTATLGGGAKKGN